MLWRSDVQVTVMERKPLPIKHPRAAYTGGDRGGRGEGRGFRPGRDGRGRNGRGEGRQYSAGRGERTEGVPPFWDLVEELAV